MNKGRKGKNQRMKEFQSLYIPFPIDATDGGDVSECKDLLRRQGESSLVELS